jgi:multidrug efflux pump subunit AcrA (membrane-fusion protein)
MMRKIWPAFLLLAMCAALAGGCGKAHQVDAAAEAPTVAVVKVTRQNLGSQLEIASELEPFQEINVYAKVSGYIQKLYVDWGTHVRQGQLLAVLEIPSSSFSKMKQRCTKAKATCNAPRKRLTDPRPSITSHT